MSRGKEEIRMFCVNLWPGSGLSHSFDDIRWCIKGLCSYMVSKPPDFISLVDALCLSHIVPESACDWTTIHLAPKEFLEDKGNIFDASQSRNRADFGDETCKPRST